MYSIGADYDGVGLLKMDFFGTTELNYYSGKPKIYQG